MAKDIVTKAEILGGEIDVRANFGQTVKVTVSPDPYMGDTEVTPSDQTQVLQTKKKFVQDDITVYPAPVETLSTTSNGTFTPSSGKVGFSQVTVDVNPDLRPLSVSENGQYSPDGFDGYSEVTVNNPAQWTTEGIADGSEPNGIIDLGDVASVSPYSFYMRNGITEVKGSNVTYMGISAFTSCENLEKISFPQLVSLVSGYVPPFNKCPKLSEVHLPRLLLTTTDATFNACTSLAFIYLPSTRVLPTSTFNACSALETAIAPKLNNINGNNVFINCSNLKTLLIGDTRRASLGNVNSFSGTPFASGGSGGDIYIPKALYDHLGDGSNLDYLSEPRWNTLNGYGTIAWHPIEGSEYETYMPGGAKYEEEMALT